MLTANEKKFLNILETVDKESLWGIAIGEVVSDPEPAKVRRLIISLRSQANDDYGVMCSILGAELTDKLLACRRSWAFKDLTGQTFTRLTVIKQVGSRKNQVLWLCKCECGNEKTAITRALTSKHTQSCGCLPTSRPTHGMSKSKFYRVWRSMKLRGIPNAFQAESYKAKNITLCDRWMTFENFYEDMFPTYRHGLTLERINNNGGYEPGNCKWATLAEQSRNKSDNVFYDLSGRSQILPDWCDEYGINISTVRARLRKGRDLATALTLPVQPRYVNGFKPGIQALNAL